MNQPLPYLTCAIPTRRYQFSPESYLEGVEHTIHSIEEGVDLLTLRAHLEDLKRWLSDLQETKRRVDEELAALRGQ